MAKAKTKVELFNEIMEVVTNEEHKVFLEKCIAQTNAKNKSRSGKQSKKATQNLAELEEIKAFVGDKTVTYKDIRHAFADRDYSSQKLTAILSLSDDLVKTKDKGVTYIAFGKNEE